MHHKSNIFNVIEKYSKVKLLNITRNCVKYGMISLCYDIVVIGALVIKFLFGIQNDGKSFYTTYDKFQNAVLKLCLRKVNVNNNFGGRKVSKLIISILTYVKVIEVADQWVGYGLMLKLIPKTENMFEGIMYEYYFSFVNYCKYKKAWMVQAKKNHEGNVIKYDTILTKLTLMD